MKKEDKNRFICAFPNCGKAFWKDPKNKEEMARPPFCSGHIKFINDMAFVQQHVKFESQKPSGLVIPKPGDNLSDLLKAK